MLFIGNFYIQEQIRTLVIEGYQTTDIFTKIALSTVLEIELDLICCKHQVKLIHLSFELL